MDQYRQIFLNAFQELAMRKLRHLSINRLNLTPFPATKKSDVTPAYKAGDSTCRNNFRPLGALSTLTQVLFERLMYSQMLPFIKPELSNLLCGFREGYSTQYALLRLVETYKQCLDSNDVMGLVLPDLSKADDCLPRRKTPCI